MVCDAGSNEAALFSADLAAFFNAPRLLWAWGWLQTETWAERELFGGVTAVLLALAAFVRTTPPDGADRTNTREQRRSRNQRRDDVDA